MTKSETPAAGVKGEPQGSGGKRAAQQARPPLVGESTLARPCDDEQALRAALLPATPSREGEGGTTAESEPREPSTRLECHSRDGGGEAAPGLGSSVLSVTPEFRERFDAEWSELSRAKVKKYRELGKSSHWHGSRARTMAIPPIERKCNTEMWVNCGCKTFQVGGCGARTCKSCNGRRWGRIRRKVLASLEPHGVNGWRMLTLAGPPRETEQESMRDLQQAWTRMRSWFWNRWNRGRKRRRGNMVYVAAVEVGSENGLIHMHVLAKFPAQLDYSEVGEQWARAYPGAVTGGAHFSKRRCGKTGRMKSVFSAKAGAAYLAKYATKGQELLDFEPEKAARILWAMTGARIVKSSSGFWTKPVNQCQDCGWSWALANTPAATRAAVEAHRAYMAGDAEEARRVLQRDGRHERAGPDGARSGSAVPEPHWGRGAGSARLLVEAKREALVRMAHSAVQDSETAWWFTQPVHAREDAFTRRRFDSVASCHWCREGFGASCPRHGPAAVRKEAERSRRQAHAHAVHQR